MRKIRATSGEKLQYLVHEHNDNTIRFVLYYPGQLKADMLSRAVCAVVERAEVLHSSFDPQRAEWIVHEAAEATCFCWQEAGREPLEEAMDASLSPLDPGGTAQLRCTLVQGRHESVVSLTVSHLVADGSDGLYLLRKITEAYRMLEERGSCDALTIKNGRRDPEQVYDGMSKQEIRSLMKNPMTGVKTVFPFPSQEEGRPWLLSRVIPAQTMEKARRRARQEGATVNDLLLTALYRACAGAAEMDNGQAISIMSMMDLRRHCPGGDTEGLCNLSGSLPTVLPEGVQGSFTDTLREIREQTTRLKADPKAGLMGMPILHGVIRRVPMRLLLKGVDRLYGGMAMGMTNLGMIRGEELIMGGQKPEAAFFAGPVKNKPGLQVSVCSLDGTCALCIAGRVSSRDVQQLNRLLEVMAQELEQFIQ